MDGCGNNEGAVERRPGDAAARARENVRGRHSFAARIEDDGDVRQHQRHHERRGQPLPDIETDVHISPLRYAHMVRRLRPAIEAGGLKRCGPDSRPGWWRWRGVET